MIKTSHLIGYYPFEGNANDASGNNNSGIVYGASLVKGKFGQCYSFDGVDDYIEIPLNSFPDSMYDITISFWAKVNQDTNFILLGNPDNDSYNRLNIHLPWNTNIYWDFGDIHSTGRLYTTWDSTWYDTWAHWVFISDSNVGQKIYRNGILLASDLTTSYFRKETRSLYLGTYYRGLIEQFQIYDKALSQLDIRRVMLGFHPFGLQFNGYYKFCSYTTNTENQSADIKLSLPAGKKITIFWGDGMSTVVTGKVTTTIFSHTYTDVKTYNLTVTGDYNDITYLRFDGDGSYGGDIKYMPDNLLSLFRWFSNTFYGNWSSFPRTLRHVGLGGSGIISGALSDMPENMWKIYLHNLSNFTGSISDFVSSLIKFDCSGTIEVTGDLADTPDNMYFLAITGHNTISEYSGKTWTTNFDIFKVVPYSGGLSSAEIDQLLIDLDNDLDWSGGGTITLTGTNEPPTGVGQAAIDNIIAEGGTVFVNDYTFCSYTTSAENQSADIKLSLPANKKITIYWGDGTSTVVTGAITTTTYSHTYTDIGVYNLTVSGDYNDITYLYFGGNGGYSGDIKYFPNNLLMVYCWEDNIFSGNVINFSRNLQRCGITGSTSITGIWNDVPEQIESFYLTGNNTLSGDIGENGTKLTALSIKGHNTISDYTSKTWTTNMSLLRLIPITPGGLSSAEMDQLIIDLDEGLDWSGGGTIVLTGTNAPRTSASDDAVSNIEAEGGTVICNN